MKLGFKYFIIRGKVGEEFLCKKTIVIMLFVVFESRLNLKLFSVKSRYIENLNFLQGKRVIEKYWSYLRSFDNNVYIKSFCYKFYGIFYLNGIFFIRLYYQI